MKLPLSTFAVLLSVASYAQGLVQKLTIAGEVKDARTQEPLAYATIGAKHHIDQTVSDENGKFELWIPESAKNDTLVVSYVGYETFEKPIAEQSSFKVILLKEYATILDEVVIINSHIDLRAYDRSARPIRGNLYAMESETSNYDYNHFLNWLEDNNKPDLRKKYDFDLSGYKKSVQDFYRRYHKLSTIKEKHRGRYRPQANDSVKNFNGYPAVNISHEGAVEYCKWLTDRYNENTGKKRFKKVVFRLPTLKEWQIAALGDPKFQSWDLRENIVEVIISTDTMNILKGQKKKMKVDDTILYPWYKAYYLRSRVHNQFGCYLGNFKIEVDRHCPSRAWAYDGFSMMGPSTAYFPNDIGLFDVVGNVAEMIDEKGKACGGSWNELPENSTIQSVKNYSGPDETVGFRVFMEVIEP